MRVVTWSDRA